jgi:hypothetical protein
MGALDRIASTVPSLAVAGALTAGAVLAWGKYYQSIGLAVCEAAAVLVPAPCAPGAIPDPRQILGQRELPPDPGPPALGADGGSGEQRYVVRLQAQGSGLQKSVTFNQPTPVTRTAAVQGLSELEKQLTSREYKARDVALRKAETWINNVATSGGSGPPGKSGFTNPGVRGKVARIDVEILAGVNLVPP